MAKALSSWIGQTLENDRFFVDEKLGEGGMAVVFKGRDLANQAEVVIKVPKQPAHEDNTFLKRFAAENRSLMSLRHPHIVNILHVGEWEDWPFAVLQYLSGGDLEACRKAFDGKLSLLNVSQWLPTIADALDFIHRQGYVHRDVKPANILFDGMEKVYLSDFGIAKIVSEQAPATTRLTGTGMVLGTPDYMAPELVMGTSVDGRVDQYALAMTVYECLAGRFPFQPETPSAILVMQATQPVPPLDTLDSAIPSTVSQPVLKALAKKTNERFSTCRDFADTLIAAIKHSGSLPKLLISRDMPIEGESERPSDALREIRPPSSQTASQGPNPPPSSRPPRETRPHRSQTVRKWPKPTPPNPPERSRNNPSPQTKPASVWRDKRFVWTAALTSLLAAVFLMVVFLRSPVQPPPIPLSKDHVERDASLIANNTGENQYNESQKAPFVPEPMPESSSDLVGQKIGEIRTDNGLKMSLVWCPPGDFTMGEDSPKVQVTLTSGFWLGQTEITQGQWETVMGTTPWKGEEYVKEGSNYPATYVSWEDAIAFCKKLTEQEQKAGRLPDDWEYTLPTEAQWEYACRAGTTTAYSFGNDESQLGDYAWYGAFSDGNAKEEKYAHAVGTKKPNPWGLLDMHGNPSPTLGVTSPMRCPRRNRPFSTT